MKKLLSLLVAILILAGTLTMFASCGVEYYVPADNVEDTDQSGTTVNSPLTEKEKSSIYESAMLALREARETGEWEAAYNNFLRIKDYENVSEYLERFYYQTGITLISEITDGSKTQFTTQTNTYTNYGYLKSIEFKDHINGTEPLIAVNSFPEDKIPYDRLTRVQYPDKLPTIYGSTAKYTLLYSYVSDTSSLVKTLTFSEIQGLDNIVIDYTYNENKSIQTQHITFRVSSSSVIKPNEYEFRYEYNENGTLSQIKFANVTDLSEVDSTERIYANYEYNAAGQLTSITYPGGIIDVPQSAILWIGAGNGQTAGTWSSENQIPTWNEENVCVITFEYNAQGHVTKEVLNYTNSDDKDETTTYDLYNENGNLMQKTVYLAEKTYLFEYNTFTLYYDPLA